MKLKRILRRFRRNTGLIIKQAYRYKNFDEYIQKFIKMYNCKKRFYENEEMPYYCKWVYLQRIPEEQENE
jgi:hypothetical protein